MSRSNNISKLTSALAKAQAELRDANKSKEGYGYKYAPLDEVLKIVRGVLAKHGISFIQTSNFFKEGVLEVTTTLFYEDEFIESKVAAPYNQLRGMNDYQSIGSGLTYLRRYGLSLAVGIASDEDNDAHGQKSIAKKEKEEILSLLQATKSDVKKFLKWLGVGSVDELNEEAYYKAKDVLLKKLEKIKKEEELLNSSPQKTEEVGE